MEEKELLLKIDELRFYVKTIGDINMLQSEFERGWDYGYRRGLKQALEILDEQRNPTGADNIERFEADMTLMCKEFSGLLEDLTTALGGEKK